jgi:hypothetical protein
LAVVGESHYLPALRRARTLATSSHDGHPVIAVSVQREPSNPHDANAVRIVSARGETLGYLPREQARWYRDVLREIEAAGQVAVCNAVLYGGDEDRANIGIWVDLLFASKLRKRLRELAVSH